MPEPENPRPLTEEIENRQLLNTSSLLQDVRLPECDANFCKTFNKKPDFQRRSGSSVVARPRTTTRRWGRLSLLQPPQIRSKTGNRRSPRAVSSW